MQQDVKGLGLRTNTITLTIDLDGRIGRSVILFCPQDSKLYKTCVVWEETLGPSIRSLKRLSKLPIA